MLLSSLIDAMVLLLLILNICSSLQSASGSA